MKSNENTNEPEKSQSFIDPMIHAPARFQIMSNLFHLEQADFLYLRSVTGLTKGNLSSHLTKLEKSGYVEIKKEFVEKISRTTIAMSKVGREAFKIYRRNLKNMLDGIPD